MKLDSIQQRGVLLQCLDTIAKSSVRDASEESLENFRTLCEVRKAVAVADIVIADEAAPPE